MKSNSERSSGFLKVDVIRFGSSQINSQRFVSRSRYLKRRLLKSATWNLLHSISMVISYVIKMWVLLLSHNTFHPTPKTSKVKYPSKASLQAQTKIISLGYKVSSLPVPDPWINTVARKLSRCELTSSFSICKLLPRRSEYWPNRHNLTPKWSCTLIH